MNKTKYSLEKNKAEVNKLIEYNEKLFRKYSNGKTKLDKIILIMQLIILFFYVQKWLHV